VPLRGALFHVLPALSCEATFVLNRSAASSRPAEKGSPVSSLEQQQNNIKSVYADDLYERDSCPCDNRTISSNMNPLSIVTNPWAILHVVDGLASLVSVLEDVANASEDLDTLQREISSLTIVLNKVLCLASTGERHSVLQESIAGSLTTVTRLKLLIGNTSGSRTGRRSRRREAALDSLVWLRKKRRVETIKQQLRDGISTIQLEILSLSL